MRIALFTPFSPDLGGGSVQLKSLLPELKGLDVVWHYLAPGPARSFPGKWMGPPLMGGPALLDIPRAIRLWSDGSSPRVREIAKELDADAVWVVAMNESVLVGLEAARLGMPLHVTVHDDPAEMIAHSRRYRWLAPLMKQKFARLLRTAKSVDTISTGMRDYYRERYRIDSRTVFRYVPSLPAVNAAIQENGTLRVGHIGSLYTTEELRRFMQALCLYGEQAGINVKFVRIGKSPQIDAVQREFARIVEDLGELPEAEAIEKLSACRFCYCMYPEGKRYELFRRTSQPMKLSTYIQAQRPIFAHTPDDSTLASAVRTHGLGTVCSAFNTSDILSAIGHVQEQRITLKAFENAREELLGVSQIGQLRVIFSELTA